MDLPGKGHMAKLKENDTSMNCGEMRKLRFQLGKILENTADLKNPYKQVSLKQDSKNRQ